MNEKELKEILDILEQAGMEPKLCDMPLPLYRGTANCGVPAIPGEGKEDDWVMFPRELLKDWDMQFFVRARGDSMTGVRIFDGDLLRVDASRPHPNGLSGAGEGKVINPLNTYT